MKIINYTKISDELIKEVALSMGVDLKEESTLTIQYSAAVNMAVRGQDLGGYCSFNFMGDTHHVIELLPTSGTEILAHELRHLYQCQSFEGFDNMREAYRLEEELEGYDSNVFEVDAREAAKAWKF